MKIETLQAILQELNTHVEGLEQVAIVKRDGTLITPFMPGEQAPHVEQMAAELAGLAEDVCQVLDRGASTEVIVKGADRFLAVYRSHKADALLGIVGPSSVNFGLLNSSGRSAIQKIESQE